MAEYGIEERFREIRTTNGGRTHEIFASSSAALIGFFGNEASNDGMSLLSRVLHGYLRGRGMLENGGIPGSSNYFENGRV